jgi:hypothetical protein
LSQTQYPKDHLYAPRYANANRSKHAGDAAESYIVYGLFGPCSPSPPRFLLALARGGAFTRLTNAFSKKWENLWAAYCLHFARYSFCRIHKTLRIAPAMEAGITDHVWTLSELLA